MKVKMLLICTCLLVCVSACSYKQTKASCIRQCEQRGAEYAGMTPDGIKSGQYGQHTHDVCHCR